jgi:CubicO group peptidase (beta-lactamase class C family)
MVQTPINGFTTKKFDALGEVFAANLEDGDDVGASVAVIVGGETVVDLWGGWADEAKTRAWQKDTIVNVYSTTKTMAALVALVLADRGGLALNAPVAHYWPEFAAAGKGNVKVSQLLSHSSGLHTWTEAIDVVDMYDWERTTALLAAQSPAWEPGSASGYHALTFGHLIGEVVRRITGKSIGEFFRDEIAGPLKADFHIGLAEKDDKRCADLIPVPPGAFSVNGNWTPLMLQVMANPAGWMDPSITRSRDWRAAEIPAANGHGNARSIAEIQSVLANGGTAKGKRLLSEAGCRRALQLQSEGTDLIIGAHVRFGMGYGLSGALLPVPNSNSVFWGGYGGSLVIIDFDAGATFSYAMNKMGPALIGDPRAMALAQAMWRCMAN